MKPVCDARCQLFHTEMIRNENALRMKWFLKNQQRLIENLKEPKLIKRARNVIADSEKRMKACVKRKPLPPWRPLKSDGTINIDVMKPVDPNVKALVYEKNVPTFIATNNYLTERYKEPPEKRFYFPDCPNWTYGWRLGDFPPVPPSEVGLRSVMLAQFYQRKSFNLHQDPEWFRGCQKKNARDFTELIY
ncbi:hypothetical protein X777_06263 [Ooceraea biroi]|uniref:Sperm microtubule inner protein 1 C-terminal domain-containing protein n=1 Tax=Ooceraea biroi TaxID=2015173 RepID=A0A026WDT4_OOCBI|nr:hypothetical protein X777_06263 [Ooceraea biroi]